MLLCNLAIYLLLRSALFLEHYKAGPAMLRVGKYLVAPEIRVFPKETDF